jgi:4-amino-4-deoxy-L-arabinose transferase-like glycosyltransferase
MELSRSSGGLPRPAFLNPWVVAGLFAALVLALRLSTFFASVIDWDESIYLLVADQWLQGHSPYTTVWDNKPPGIYILFVLALKLFGRSVFAIRLLACISVTATCLLISRIGNLASRNGWLAGLLAGGLYALLTVRNDGRSANTEVFFLAFTAGAWLLVLSRACSDEPLSPRDYRRMALAGLLLGLGFEIKYVVLFDAVAIAAIFLLAVRRRPAEERTPARIAGLLAAMAAGFLLPFLAITAAFAIAHRFPEYWAQNFTSNRARTVGLQFRWSIPALGIWDQLRLQGIFWIGIPLAAAAVFRDRAAAWKDRFLVATTAGYLIWLVLCIAAVFRSHLYHHYFLPLAGPLAVLGADAAIRLAFPGASEGRISRGRVAALAAALALVGVLTALPQLRHGASLVYRRLLKAQPDEDRPALIAEYLKTRMGPQDVLYVADDQPVLYFLVPSRLPTRYVFPAYLVRRRDLPDITGVDPILELQHILDQKPLYVVKKRGEHDRDYDEEANKPFFTILDGALARDYDLETTIKEVDLFRRKR